MAALISLLVGLLEECVVSYTLHSQCDCIWNKGRGVLPSNSLRPPPFMQL